MKKTFIVLCDSSHCMMNERRSFMHAGCSIVMHPWHRQVMPYFLEYGAAKDVEKLYIPIGVYTLHMGSTLTCH